MRALAVLPACALIAAGCGGSRADTTWQRNATGLVAQLRADVAAVQSVPATQSAGSLYALLVAYSDMGGCSKMVAATGAPPRVQRVLAAPCPDLERAARLFTQAETHGDAGVLRRAAQMAARGGPGLVRAALVARR